MFSKKLFLVALLFGLISNVAFVPNVYGITRTPVATLATDSGVLTATDEANLTATPSGEITTTETIQVNRTDLTNTKEETIEPLKKILDDNKIDKVWPFNFLKSAIRASVDSGIPPNTIVLLLLLPGVAAIIATARHLVGLRGFGIFLPAALSVVFVATGPLLGIALFLVIVIVSTTSRISLQKSKLKLQYLPRMSIILLMVVLGILGIFFLAPLIGADVVGKVSIFPILIIVLLAEEFNRVQIGKSAEVAIHLTTETLILALISYIFLTLNAVQTFVLLNPEIYLLSIAIFNLVIGRYVGLRLAEYWRFRKLIWG